MKLLLTHFGIFIVFAQSTLCVPIAVEEPAVQPELRDFIGSLLSALSQSPIVNDLPIPVKEPTDQPELRDFIGSILTALSQSPLVNGLAQALATTGDEIIESAITSGGNFFSSLMAGLNSNPEVAVNSNTALNSQPMIVPQSDEMLDVLDALVDQMILDQPIGTTETVGNDDERVSLDESDEVPDQPLYLVVLP